MRPGPSWFPLLAVALTLLAGPLAAPLESAEVRNVVARQEGNGVVFTYDLSGTTGKSTVGVLLSVNGMKFTDGKAHLEGDFGEVTGGNGKRIAWNVLGDIPAGVQGTLEWEIFVREGDGTIAKRTVRVRIVDKRIEAKKLPLPTVKLFAGIQKQAGLMGYKAVSGDTTGQQADGILNVQIEEFSTGSTALRVLTAGISSSKTRLRFSTRLTDPSGKSELSSKKFENPESFGLHTGTGVESLMIERVGLFCASFLQEYYNK